MAPYDADENIQSSFIVDSFICAVNMDFCLQIIKAGLNFQSWKLICLFYWSTIAFRYTLLQKMQILTTM